jgi:hypothetical protein
LQKLHEPTLVHGRQQGTGEDVDFTTRHRTKFLLVLSLGIISIVIFHAHGGQKPSDIMWAHSLQIPVSVDVVVVAESSAVSTTLPENSKASAYRTSLIFRCMFVSPLVGVVVRWFSCKTRKSAFTPREPQISNARQESGAFSDMLYIEQFLSWLCQSERHVARPPNKVRYSGVSDHRLRQKSPLPRRRWQTKSVVLEASLVAGDASVSASNKPAKSLIVISLLQSSGFSSSFRELFPVVRG